MTPLIDVMLVLLIFSSSRFQTDARRKDRQSAAAAPNFVPPPPPEVIDLTIDFDGTLLWNKSPWTERPCRATSNQSTEAAAARVHITVDKFAKYEIVGRPWLICSTAD